MNLEDIIQSEVNQTLKDKYCILLIYVELNKAEFTATQIRAVVFCGWGVEEKGRLKKKEERKDSSCC